MMFIDVTSQLRPLLLGIDLILLVSGSAIAGGVLFRFVRSWVKNVRRPRLVLHRPLLADHPSR